jgi:hypothetical protein
MKNLPKKCKNQKQNFKDTDKKSNLPFILKTYLDPGARPGQVVEILALS